MLQSTRYRIDQTLHLGHMMKLRYTYLCILTNDFPVRHQDSKHCGPTYSTRRTAGMSIAFDHIWMGGDVTGQLMESRFAEYSEFGGDYLPNHYNASISTITQAQCSQSNEFGGILMGAGSTTSAESLNLHDSCSLCHL